jgi:hypothetical protein
MRVCVLVLVGAARLRRVTPHVPEQPKPQVEVPVPPFPSTLLDTLRTELSATDETMRKAAEQVKHLEGSNVILQNLVITAFRQMQDLRDVMETMTPELEGCIDTTMPDRLNVSDVEFFAPHEDLHGWIQNSSNHSSQALRAEMHLLRVYDEQMAQYRRELEACRLCEPPTLVIALQATVRNESKPVLPRLIDELEELNSVFGTMAAQKTAHSASEKVLEGMSAEAMKALFSLQHEVDSLQENVWECGNRTAPFDVHIELGEHMQNFPKVSAAMIHRAQDETEKRAKEVADIAEEVTECKKTCPSMA